MQSELTEEEYNRIYREAYCVGKGCNCKRDHKFRQLIREAVAAHRRERRDVCA